MSETTTKQIKDGTAEIPATSMQPGKALGNLNLIRFAAVFLLFIVFSITAPYFFTMRSILSLALQTSTVTLMGIGVTFAIISGGIDLSIGSVVALSGTVAVMAAIAGVSPTASW